MPPLLIFALPPSLAADAIAPSPIFMISLDIVIDAAAFAATPPLPADYFSAAFHRRMFSPRFHCRHFDVAG